MLSLNDVLTIEGEIEADELEQFAAIQRAIDGGTWGLQGSFGRTMMDAIQSGRCMLGRRPAHDYWGSSGLSPCPARPATRGPAMSILIDLDRGDLAGSLQSAVTGAGGVKFGVTPYAIGCGEGITMVRFFDAASREVAMYWVDADLPAPGRLLVYDPPRAAPELGVPRLLLPLSELRL